MTSKIIQAYGYDYLNRLKSSTKSSADQISWKQTFDYDRFGNLIFDTVNTMTLGPGISPKITNPWISKNNNRLKKDHNDDAITDYDYDKVGNPVIDAENKHFVFDAENRMKELFHTTLTLNTPDAVYSYEGRVRNVKKLSGNRQTIFVYDDTGKLVAEYSQLAQSPQISYLTAAHLRSPRVITDGRGEVISRHDYMAFGSDITETIGNVDSRTTAHGYNSADSVRKQYTGYERDDESGLGFAQARYYNSNHGRFTSVDPLTASVNVKNPQTLNRYTYVLNSPYKFTDPLGLISNTATCRTGYWSNRISKKNRINKPDDTVTDNKSSDLGNASNRILINVFGYAIEILEIFTGSTQKQKAPQIIGAIDITGKPDDDDISGATINISMKRITNDGTTVQEFKNTLSGHWIQELGKKSYPETK